MSGLADSLFGDLIRLVARKLSMKRESIRHEASRMGLVELPDELLLVILSSLDRSDLLSLARTIFALRGVVEEALSKTTTRTLNVHATDGANDTMLRWAVKDESILRTIGVLDIHHPNFISRCAQETGLKWPGILWGRPCDIPLLPQQDIVNRLFRLIESLPKPTPIRIENILVRRPYCTCTSCNDRSLPNSPTSRFSADVTPSYGAGVRTKRERRFVRLDAFSANFRKTEYGNFSFPTQPIDVDFDLSVSRLTGMIINLHNRDLCLFNSPNRELLPPSHPSSYEKRLHSFEQELDSFVRALRPLLERASTSGFPIVVRSRWDCIYDLGCDSEIKRIYGEAGPAFDT